MKQNVGSADRAIRFAFGVALIGASFFYSWWLSVVGVVLVGTAVLAWCPPYALLGISSCKRQ